MWQTEHSSSPHISTIVLKVLPLFLAVEGAFSRTDTWNLSVGLWNISSYLSDYWTVEPSKARLPKRRFSLHRCRTPEQRRSTKCSSLSSRSGTRLRSGRTRWDPPTVQLWQPSTQLARQTCPTPEVEPGSSSSVVLWLPITRLSDVTPSQHNEHDSVSHDGSCYVNYMKPGFSARRQISVRTQPKVKQQKARARKDFPGQGSCLNTFHSGGKIVFDDREKQSGWRYEWWLLGRKADHGYDNCGKPSWWRWSFCSLLGLRFWKWKNIDLYN